MITSLLSLLILVSGNEEGTTKRTLLGLFIPTKNGGESEKYQRTKTETIKGNFRFLSVCLDLKDSSTLSKKERESENL